MKLMGKERCERDIKKNPRHARSYPKEKGKRRILTLKTLSGRRRKHLFKWMKGEAEVEELEYKPGGEDKPFSEGQSSFACKRKRKRGTVKAPWGGGKLRRRPKNVCHSSPRRRLCVED